MAKLSFKLLNNADHFQLDIISLSLNEYAIYGVVKKTLDREFKDEYELLIEARDYGYPQSRINRNENSHSNCR